MLFKYNLMKIFTILIVLAFIVAVLKAKLGKFVRYDIECPFLIDDEYKLRLRQGRCPPMPPSPPPR